MPSNKYYPEDPLDRDAYRQAKTDAANSKLLMNPLRWALFFFCVVLFLLSILLSKKLGNNNNAVELFGFHLSAARKTVLNASLTQFRLLLTVFISMRFYRVGFLGAVLLNIYSLLAPLRAMILSPGDFDSLLVLFPLVGILMCLIVFAFHRLLYKGFAMLDKSRREIISLYEELSAASEEVSQQNHELSDYNERLIDNEKQLNYIAYYDILTKLPNRKMIENELTALVSRGEENGENRFAVAFIDLDNFKIINDTTGHHTGDQFLVKVTERMKSYIYDADILGRIGGDEFALIIKRGLSNHEAVEYVNGIKDIMQAPFNVDGIVFNITASMGVAFFPDDGATADEMLRCADTAMYRAKDEGKNAVVKFCSEMKMELLQKINFEKNLLSSLSNKEIYLAFQPQFSDCGKRLRGFEVLARWNSAAFGLVPPNKFIPVAEETKYILRLGEWILREACEKFKCFTDNDDKLVLSVNISAVQLMDPGFIGMVGRILQQTGYRPNQLELEITETALITSPRLASQIMTQLKGMGTRIALDDFGTGYSSLNYLQQLPIDTLKIDKIFVDNITGKDDEKLIIGSIIALVHKLDMNVIAEGVENDFQLDYLENQHCDCIQGFLLGKPVSYDEAGEIIRRASAVKI
ncbi:MAG: EAL domain-containing protein [Oscillospiraceae bacterium]